jgi:acyl-coenzyme A synthetase/AMP-(fatty) acid ligase
MALMWRQGAISYGDIRELMSSAGNALSELEPGAICVPAEKTPQTIAAVLAALDAGRPVLLPATTLPPLTLDALVQAARCRLSWTAAGWQETAKLGHAPTAASFQQAAAFMLTTSGSTGMPKIVPIGDRAAARFADWADAQFGLGAGRRVFNYAPLNFDLCLLEVWGTLQCGGCVVLVDRNQATDARALREWMTDSEPHVIQAVPLLFELLTAGAGANGQPSLAAVEHVVSTGDMIRPACLQALPALFPKARLYSLYGCTETNDSFLHEIDPQVEPPVPLPLGQPLPGVHALLVDEAGIVDGVGAGELWVSTPFQATSYVLGASDRFMAHPSRADNHCYFRSGDLVRRHADGRLTLEGRVDFQVKVRGQRVNLQEVESVLRQHPAVLDAVAVVVENPPYGDLLHVVARRTSCASVNSLELKRHCSERLPAAAVPSTLRFSDPPFPLTSTGKPDRKAIQAEVRRHLEEAKES